MNPRISRVLFASLVVFWLTATALADVYVTRTGQKYHERTSCRGLNRARDIFTVSLETALARGLDPCAICGGGSSWSSGRSRSPRRPATKAPPKSAPKPFAIVAQGGLDPLDRFIGRLNSSLIDPAELAVLTPVQLRTLRNAVFARRGYVFRSPDLRAYFETKSWYRPTVRSMDAIAKRLTSTENANLRAIMGVEAG